MSDAVSVPCSTVESFRIPDNKGGEVKFSLRRPKAPADERLPLLIVLGGVKTNERTLTRAPVQKRNALITYEYDYDKEDWRRWSYPNRARHVLRMTVGMSGQIEALLVWVQSRSWIDPERINVVGGSVGAIYLPMILRDLQAKGLGFRTVTLAYGGAGRTTMCYLMLRHRSRVLAAIGATLCWLLLRRMEPATHLPHLKGEFLLISSLDDERIPRRCSKLFEDLTPETKTIIHTSGQHVDTEHPHVLDEVFATTLGWLVENRALNP